MNVCVGVKGRAGVRVRVRVKVMVMVRVRIEVRVTFVVLPLLKSDSVSYVCQVLFSRLAM